MFDTRTDRVLFDMFTENTGIHGMDSGGSFGRHWQRNQTKTFDEFMNTPDGIHHYDPENPENSYFTISTFHYLRKNLSVSDGTIALTQQWREWIDTMPKGEYYYNSGNGLWDFLETQVPEVLAELNHDTDYPVPGDNTYNAETFLDQDFQFWTIGGEEFDPVIVALSIHNGADIRGGYTDLVFFEADHDYWVHGVTDLSLECPKCHESGYISGFYDEAWEYIDNPFFNLSKGCPNGCGPLVVTTTKFEI